MIEQAKLQQNLEQYFSYYYLYCINIIKYITGRQNKHNPANTHTITRLKLGLARQRQIFRH